MKCSLTPNRPVFALLLTSLCVTTCPAQEANVTHEPAVEPINVGLGFPADSYFASAEGRKILKYLVRCALEGNTRAQVTLPDEKLILNGSIGLAPGWIHRPLRLDEQRWVSACVYALTNKMGKSVRVSLSGSHPKLTSAETGHKISSLFEGGFFGNLFLPTPIAYVCEGSDRKKLSKYPIGSLRLCAKPSGKTTKDGKVLSECGFIITGPCSSPSSFVVEGEFYKEVVQVWLPTEQGE